jgi:hypothetical protein
MVTDIEEQMMSAPPELAFDLKKAFNDLQEIIEEKSRQMVVVSEQSPGVFQARMIIKGASENESDDIEKGKVIRAVVVVVDLMRWSGNKKEEISAEGDAFLIQDPEQIGQREGFAKVLNKAIAKAVSLIDLQMESQHLPQKRLQEILAGDNVDDRLSVLRTLRERRMPSLMPDVIAMLSDSNMPIVLEAIGVLVAHKERKAVAPLIRLTRGRDHIFLLQIITAVTEIGGPIAKGYLFTLAAGHNYPEIRRRAKAAMERIIRYEKSTQTESTNKAIALPNANEESDASSKR